VLGCGLLLLVGGLALCLVPLPAALLTGQTPGLEILDRTGQPLRLMRHGDDPFSQQVNYGQIPEPLVRATLAAEDKRFWQHRGVDWRATLRAAWQFTRYRRIRSGGSTITQQLIKLAEPRPRTLRTKITEAAQALRLEQVWNKQRILAEYLNRLDYGNFSRGCAASAKFYFDKPLSDLSPAECALLAGLPQAPSRLNPRLHLDRALKRQHWVLNQMRLTGALSQDQLQEAGSEPLRLAFCRRGFEAPHFLNFLAEAGRALPSGAAGRPIRTTLDLALNKIAEQILRQRLAGLKTQHVSNGAVVVLDNETGGVLALVGSANYFSADAGQVNGAWALRSAGSTFKPFTYLLAFERGATPASIVADVPTQFRTATGVFAPVNYNRHCYGPTRFRLALANSLNISAVKVLASIGGPAPLQQLLQQCGLSTLDRPTEEYGLGLTIGNADARLLELANAYACLARLGQYRPYRLVLSESATREPRGTGPALPCRVADASAAYLIADILSDNDARALAFGADSALRFGFPVACKTGTSSDFRDNWAFGYTPEFTVGVWVGNFDGSPMQGVSGVTGAAPIMHELFECLHERFGTSWYEPPTDIVEGWIDPTTGGRLDATQVPSGLSAGTEQRGVQEKFIASHLPPMVSRTGSGLISLSSEYGEWLASGDNWLGSRATLAESDDSLRILFPLPGTTFYLDPDMHEQGRHITMQARGSGRLEWRSGTLPLTQQGNRSTALLSEGRHAITVRDPVSGAQAETWVDVLPR